MMRHESVFRQIARDWRACFERDPAAKNWLEVLFAYPGFHAIFWHRLVAHPLQRWHVPVIPRLFAHLVRFLTGVEIHPGAQIGGGLFIDHGMGVVIGETTEIGEDCTLYQGVTLGGTSLERRKRHPTLDDDVVVGAGATVLGAIQIGAGTKVAAGAVVVRSVPPNSVVVGVPGHVTLVDGKRVEPSALPQVNLPDPEGEAIAELQRRARELETRLNELERRHGTPTL